MDTNSSRRYYLLTYPRTASNLLIKILALQDQPSLLQNEKSEYFFLSTMKWRLGTETKLASKHIDQWTDEERAGLMECYQSCFESLKSCVNTARLNGKNIYVKEHAPWLMEPVAETKFVFGEDSTREEPWTVRAFPEQTRSHLNETILPDEFLRTWLPTFLIRHPALVFPSIYRTSVDLEGVEAAKDESGHTLEMTMRWSRTLYDWYTQRSNSLEVTSDPHVSWPIVLDADDVMMEPEVVRRYSELIGLDPTKLKFSWQPLGTEELDKMPNFKKRMLSTIISSDGIVPGKTSVDIDIDVEAEKWMSEFGENEGTKIEKWVRAAMPDYEYMRAKRLLPLRSS